MFNLARQERLIIAFLVVGLLAGIFVLGCREYLARSVRIVHLRQDSRRFDLLDETVRSDKEKIDINEASVSDLARLAGIDKSIAERIVSYRSSAGRFYSIEDIKKVKGIGTSIFGKIKDDIKV